MPIGGAGVSTFMSPVFATCPAAKLIVPWIRLIRAEFVVPFGSYTISFSTIRALADRLKAVPSMKPIPRLDPERVWTTSPWYTRSPTFRVTGTPLRIAIAALVDFSARPIGVAGLLAPPNWGGGLAGGASLCIFGRARLVNDRIDDVAGDGRTLTRREV